MGDLPEKDAAGGEQGDDRLTAVAKTSECVATTIARVDAILDRIRGEDLVDGSRQWAGDDLVTAAECLRRAIDEQHDAIEAAIPPAPQPAPTPARLVRRRSKPAVKAPTF